MTKAVDRKRARMQAIVARLQLYVATYSEQVGYQDYSDTILIDDVLYGLGIALEPKLHYGANGFDKFKQVLRDRLSEQHSAATTEK